MTALLVATGAAVGAPMRYLVDRWLQARHRHLPWGTLVVNVAGSLVAGGTVAAVTERGAATWLLPAVAIGFCGSLTTFSTFAYETVALVEDGVPLRALLNVLANVALALGACVVGFALVATV